jgi:hypothetical protein
MHPATHAFKGSISRARRTSSIAAGADPVKASDEAIDAGFGALLALVIWVTEL